MHRVQRLKCGRWWNGGFHFSSPRCILHANECLCRPEEGCAQAIIFFFPSYLCLWSVNEAIFVCYLELHWPTEAVLHHFSTPLRDRKSPLPCRLGALPSVLTLAVRTRHFSQGSEDWHPFHFPAWAAQIKGHIFKPLCEYAGCKERWVCGPELSRCINFIEGGGAETGLDGVWVGWVSQQTTDLTDC